jgi:hypothetical protein
VLQVAGSISREVIGFLIYLISVSCIMVRRSTQPLTEISTRNPFFVGCKERPARKAENLTAICEPIIYKMWDPDVSQPCGPPRPVTGIALPLFSVELGDDCERMKKNLEGGGWLYNKLLGRDRSPGPFEYKEGERTTQPKSSASRTRSVHTLHTVPCAI